VNPYTFVGLVELCLRPTEQRHAHERLRWAHTGHEFAIPSAGTSSGCADIGLGLLLMLGTPGNTNATVAQ
jgi:hypothetical protein